MTARAYTELVQLLVRGRIETWSGLPTEAGLEYLEAVYGRSASVLAGRLSGRLLGYADFPSSDSTPRLRAWLDGTSLLRLDVDSPRPTRPVDEVLRALGPAEIEREPPEGEEYDRGEGSIQELVFARRGLTLHVGGSLGGEPADRISRLRAYRSTTVDGYDRELGGRDPSILLRPWSSDPWDTA